MAINKIEDATGKAVGKLLFVVDENIAYVELTISGHNYYAQVTRDAIIPTDTAHPIWWAAITPGIAPGCGNGQPYSQLPLPPPVDSFLFSQLPLTFELPGWTVYKPDLTVEPQIIEFPFGCKSENVTCACDDGGGPPTYTVVPAIAVINLRDIYTPPFRFA